MKAEDTGVGIKNRIWGSSCQLNQGDTHYSHGLEGTGLGLTFPKALAR